MKNTILRLVEQYIEYAVLGIVVVLFCVYLAMQFVGDPNAASGGKGSSPISPADVNGTLEVKAKELQDAMGVKGLKGLVQPESPDLLERYEAAAGEPVVSSTWSSFAVAPRGAVDEEGGQAAVEVTAVNVPDVPAPSQAFVYQSYDTLTEEAVSGNDELTARFGAAPHDVTWLTVAAEFNIDEVLNRFKSDGADGARSMSERWYNGQIDILDVRIERRTVQPDGSLSEPEPIALLPGQLSYRTRIEGDVSARDKDEILDDLRSDVNQQLVVRPEFLPTTAARWEDPAEAAARVARDGEEDPRERLVRLIVLRRKLEEQLAGLGGGGGDTPGGGGASPPIGGGGGGLGEPPAGGGGGVGGGGGPSGGQPGGDRAQLIKRLERQIRRASIEITSLAKRLGWTDKQIEEAEPGDGEAAAPFELRGTLWIWAHDIEVEPGASYEYRVSVDVYNPLFAKSLSLPESQRPLAKQVSLASLPGKWSEPISVRPPTLAFMSRATAAGQGRGQAGAMGLGVAQVDVYRFHNGAWHISKQTVQPGDTIGGLVEAEDGQSLDFATGWYVLDIVADPLATALEADSGRGALVLLGSIDGGGVAEIRRPLLDRAAFRPEVEEVAEGPDEGA